ncbi:ATPase [methane-oxidizing endosymbiont of Gigantopelta aegis]|uniref:ATPase n=1 Tax=methane-oxidizing endosymbiont of Gigantopelta aegis TaxID=2794938 RepID=UPI0018DE5694|nr:ATPase [methane-oxidizing endosymbiont of Gigantopelta aegis]
MKMSPQDFLDWKSKSITLLAMSGAGKTTLAKKLPRSRWFHYSGDYRIGTKYLDEPILDNVKRQAMDVPFLRKLLLNDSIYIRNNITFDNLDPVSCFLGKLGNPDLGGLPLDEFKRRQNLHRQAEIAAMNDVPAFIEKAEQIYGYTNFINDAGGSVCELDDPGVLETLAEHTLIIYIKIPPSLEKTIIARAKSDPKPLYYREAFLDEQLTLYMAERGYRDSNQIPPDDFVSWVFPHLFKSRLPRYQAIADQFGYTVSAEDTANVTSEDDFIHLIADAIAKQS